MKWFRIYHELIEDPAVQTLSAKSFKSEFLAAIDGKPSSFSRFIRKGSDRLEGPEWAKLRAQIFQRDDFTCQYCRARGARLECDHVVPVSRGGDNTPANLKTACFDCNRSKRDKTPEEWMAAQ